MRAHFEMTQHHAHDWLTCLQRQVKSLWSSRVIHAHNQHQHMCNTCYPSIICWSGVRAPTNSDNALAPSPTTTATRPRFAG